MSTLYLDNAATLGLIVHDNQECSLTFQLEDGETWDVNGKILISTEYSKTVIKEYIVGDGVTIPDDLLWEFNPNDWDNKDVVYDFSFIRIANNQRDMKGRITVNKSLL